MKQVSWKRDCGSHANEHSGLRRKIEIFTLLRSDVNGCADNAVESSTRYVAEKQPNEITDPGSHASGQDVALDVTLFFQHVAFRGFHVLSRLLVFGTAAVERNYAHLHGENAALHFDGIEHQV